MNLAIFKNETILMIPEYSRKKQIINKKGSKP